MSTDAARITDTLVLALDRARELASGLLLVGYGVITVHDQFGRLKDAQPFTNLITDAGDLYYAGKAIAAIAPANPAAPTAATGMKLGTGTTAAAKAGAGGALVTYLTASNIAFDATYPQTANLGAGLGVNAVYKTTWAAGVATNAAITEAVIDNDSATNATSTAANTYSRVVFTAVNKGASDTLAITWNHKMLGA
ncbi:MAG: hypothetical protein ABIR39_16555 [Nocardioides sp.]|uniref:hypothetical protein n=1 Tax=Nocardioides sp. TaxID=35761 RepID=UPI003262E6F2